MVHAIDTAAFWSLLQAGDQVLVPHTHAARIWRSRLPGNSGHADTSPPLSWTEWTSALWSGVLMEGGDDRVLLNSLQEEQLWTGIIAGSESAAHLAPSAIRDLAALAASGLRRAAALRCVGRLAAEADTPDARSFAAWWDTLQGICARDRLLPSAQLEDALAVLASSGKLRIGARLALVGFEDVTLAQQALLTALEAQGAAVTLYSLVRDAAETSDRSAVRVSDEHTELRFAVDLIRQRALAHGVQSFALITSDPAACQPELERLFRQKLAPELDDVASDLSSRPWHFAQGAPLRTRPVLSVALNLLHWLHEPLSAMQSEQLLLSPFLEFQSDPGARARFDLPQRLRTRRLRPSLTLADFLTLVSVHEQDAQGTPLFSELQLLQDSVSALKLAGARDTFPVWAERIRGLLRVAGWPGQRELSPEDFLAVEAWEGLLDQLSSLQLDAGRVPFSTALALLLRQAERTPAPAAVRDVPVSVLTLEQAQALTFDVAVVLDATDRNLPAPQARHPLLPQALQRRLGIGDPEQRLGAARDQLRSLLHRTGQVVLLAPLDSSDTPTELTPLAEVLQFALRESSTFLPSPQTMEPVTLETTGTETALSPLPQPDVQGGADVLRLQAACGFQAFTTYRLGARDRQVAALGLDPRNSGSLLHKAMQHFWAGVQDQATLRALASDALEIRIEDAVSAAMADERATARAHNAWEKHFLQVVKGRFQRLLAAWMAREAEERSPFRVLSQEEEAVLDLGAVRLKMRTDRVDEVEDGVVLVDYKTASSLSADHWLGERPDAPQLPAYALLRAPDTVRAIAFAKVRPGEGSQWISLTEDDRLFPKKGRKVAVLSEQLEAWRAEITRLGEAFAGGEADVAPKEYPKTCKFCALRTLCRLDPATLLEEDEAEEDELLGAFDLG